MSGECKQGVYSWPANMLADGTPLEVDWIFDLALPPEDLWLYLRDTSRLNRALGLGEMHFEERGGRLWGRSRTGGIEHAWVEHPWSWIAAQSVVAVREYQAGFAKWVRAVYRLEANEAGTRLHVYFGWIPRGAWQRLVLKASLGWVRGNYERVLRDMERFHGDATAPPPYRPPPATAAHGLARLGELVEDLVERGEDPSVVRRLAGHLAQGDELELHRIRVLGLARGWGVDADDLIRTCLQATRSGMLVLSWDVICPHCRGVRSQHERLADLPTEGRCEICVLDFATDGLDAIEVTFGVHPSIRDVPERFYCAAEPAMKPHVVVQQLLRPGERIVIDVELRDEPHRRRIQGRAGHDVLDGGPAQLVFENTWDSDIVALVERAGWREDLLRPVRLFNLQEFRDLFGEEYLGTEVRLAVGEQTVLFTDVVGSTRMYVERGDPGAFAAIKAHFTDVIRCVSEHNGAVVKTIGDAVMAAFADPVDAIEAAEAIQRAFPEDREDLDLRLRISMNTGPCIAVRLNANIDYFGTTVNLAAKLQGCVGAGEVVVSAQTFEAAGVREHLSGRSLEDLAYAVAALAEEPLTVRRWKVS